MKNKTLLIIFGIILVATLVTAQIIFTITPVDFTPEPRGRITLYEGNITFNCKGSPPMSIYVSSGDERIADDFEQVVSSLCTSQVTNIRDWNDRTYKENQYGLRSFDEDVLKEDICNRNAQIYNRTSGRCAIVVEEILSEI